MFTRSFLLASCDGDSAPATNENEECVGLYRHLLGSIGINDQEQRELIELL